MSNKRARTSISCAVAVLAIWASAPPAQASIAPVIGDTYLAANSPTTPGGGDTNLAVAGVSSTPGTAYALLQFDLSSLPAPGPGVQAVHATLTFFVNQVTAPSQVMWAPVLGAWSEGTVTYQTAPAIGSVMGETAVNVETASQFVSIDVSQVVNSWLSGALANNGIALQAGS